jgi:ADP-ribose pyrophosphatase
MKSWKTLTRSVLLHMDKWLTVEDRTVETPDGKMIEHWPWVITPDYINVLPVDEAGRFLVFRQGKYGLEGESLALVGGYIEPGEEPLAAAMRELREETGYEAAEWTPLGHFLMDPNRGVATGNLYLAHQARKVTERDADDLEEQHLLLISLAELESALNEGQFKVMAWAGCAAMVILRMKNGSK